MVRIFLSHANADAPSAVAICDALEAAGFRCWIAPRDIVPGKRYAEAIVEGVDRCDLLLLILSSLANDSSHVLREVERAASSGKDLLTVRIEEVDPAKGLAYFIQAHQWLEAAETRSDQVAAQVVRALRAREVPADEQQGTTAGATQVSGHAEAALVPVERDDPAGPSSPARRRAWPVAAILVPILIGAAYLLLPDAADRQERAEASLSALKTSVEGNMTRIRDALREPAPSFLAGRDAEIDRQRGELSAVQEQLTATLGPWRTLAGDIERTRAREPEDLVGLEATFATLSAEAIGNRPLEEALAWSSSAASTIELLVKESETRERERVELLVEVSEQVAALEKPLEALRVEGGVLPGWADRDRLDQLASSARITLGRLREQESRLSQSAYPDRELLEELKEGLRELDLDSVQRELATLVTVLEDYRTWVGQLIESRSDARRAALREGASLGRRLVSAMKEARSGTRIPAGVPGEAECAEKHRALRRIQDGLQEHEDRLRSEIAGLSDEASLAAPEPEYQATLTGARSAFQSIDEALPAMSKEARGLAVEIERLASAALLEVNRENELRARADEEVRWALGVEGGAVHWIDGGERQGLVPNRHLGHNAGGTQRVGVTFQKGGYTDFPVCVACAKFTEKAVKVRMRLNGDREAQHYTSFPDEPEWLDEKRGAIQQALASDLNRRIPGLQLAPEDIGVDWPRSSKIVDYKPELNEFLAEGFSFSIPQRVVPSELTGVGARNDPSWEARIRTLEEFLETLGD